MQAKVVRGRLSDVTGLSREQWKQLSPASSAELQAIYTHLMHCATAHAWPVVTASISATVFGREAGVKFSYPSLVISRLSSIRTPPTPQYCASLS